MQARPARRQSAAGRLDRPAAPTASRRSPPRPCAARRAPRRHRAARRGHGINRGAGPAGSPAESRPSASTGLAAPPQAADRGRAPRAGRRDGIERLDAARARPGHRPRCRLAAREALTGAPRKPAGALGRAGLWLFPRSARREAGGAIHTPRFRRSGSRAMLTATLRAPRLR